MIGLFGDYQTARLMQASSSYLTDLQGSFVGGAQGLTPIFSQRRRVLREQVLVHTSPNSCTRIRLLVN